MNTYIYRSTLFIILSALCSILLFSCKSKNEPTAVPEIKIGSETSPLKEISLTKDASKDLLLFGGNGRYEANAEKSDIAHVQVIKDTLRIKGLKEGETFATISSHNMKARLTIKVIPPDLGMSQKEITLFPGTINKEVSLSGSDRTKLSATMKPEGCITYKWESGQLVIDPKYEGDATITASYGGKEEKLSIKVRCEGELSEAFGLYDTVRRSLQTVMNARMYVHKVGQSIRMYDSLFPTSSKANLNVTLSSTPEKGKSVKVTLQGSGDSTGALERKLGKGPQSVELEVTEVTPTAIHLLGKGFKLVLPTESL